MPPSLSRKANRLKASLMTSAHAFEISTSYLLGDRGLREFLLDVSDDQSDAGIAAKAIANLTDGALGSADLAVITGVLDFLGITLEKIAQDPAYRQLARDLKSMVQRREGETALRECLRSWLR
jgi:hypothetical protein